MKEKRPLNPAEAYRRSLKKKAKKEKAGARKERLMKIPIDKRDPYQLIDEIQKYNILEHEGKLTGDGRSYKKRLTDRFVSLRKARLSSGLECPALPEFDPEEYEAKKAQAKSGAKPDETIKRALEAAKGFHLDPLSGLPRLPDGEPPFPDGIPGLPSYRTIDHVPEDSEDELDEEPSEPGPEQQDDSIVEDVDLTFAAPSTIRRVKKEREQKRLDVFLDEINNL